MYGYSNPLEGLTGWFIFGAIVALIVALIVANEFGNIAEQKGYEKAKYFWYSFLFGIMGALTVVALPDRRNAASNVESDKTNDSGEASPYMNLPTI